MLSIKICMKLRLSLVLFALIACKNNINDDKNETININIDLSNALLIDGDFKFSIDKYMLYIDERIEDNEIIKLSNLDDGWHFINVNNDYKTYNFFINKLKEKPSVLLPEKTVFDGRRIKKNVYRKKYKKYLQSNYSIKNAYFGSYHQDTSELDENGIPFQIINETKYYNPCTICQYGLNFYNGQKMTEADKKEFLFITDFICKNIVLDDGAAPYKFDFTMHGIILNAPWYSAMAEGQILSLLSRAYYITNNKAYLQTGEKVFQFMIKDKCFGGTSTNISQFTSKSEMMKKYNNYEIYEEYVSETLNLVLNGDLFALVGLHDFYEVTGDDTVKTAFLKGCNTIEFIIPYYDLYGCSSYDLVHFIIPNSYTNFGTNYSHDYHIVLLDALYKYTNNEVFKKYCDIFIEYIENIAYYGDNK